MSSLFSSNLRLPKDVASLEGFYKNYSSTISALNLTPGSANVIHYLSKGSQPLGTTMPLDEVYAFFLAKCAPNHLRGCAKKHLEGAIALLDPKAKDAFVVEKSSGVAIRCLFKRGVNDSISRVFLLLKDELVKDCSLHWQYLGNVDLFLYGDNIGYPLVLHNLIGKNPENISHISFSSWIEVARFLDGGQRINLAEICSYSEDFFAHMPGRNDLYAQHYSQLKEYIFTLPNGKLILKPMERSFSVVHQSPFKKEILLSKQLKVSRGGCIGNLVYTTELLGKDGKDLGGHALGLLERKHVEPSQIKENLLLLQVKKTGNFFTNWIDKQGRGSLILSARSKILEADSPLAFHKSDKMCGLRCKEQYRKLFPFFQLCLSFSYLIKEKSSLAEPLVDKFFDALTQSANPSLSSFKAGLINGIYFEVIKDYILLFQDDPISRLFRENKSFNMGLQYEIFFTLCPELQKNWDTTKFSPSFEQVFDVLHAKGLLSNKMQKSVFKKFFVERLTYYIGVGLLEGETTLPDPDELYSFEDLVSKLPNLSGILYNNSLKVSCDTQDYVRSFSKQMRIECEKFYGERYIDFAVKCGLARTEEVGLAETAVAEFYDYDMDYQSTTLVRITPKNSLPDMKIGGVSATNGFTSRPESIPYSK